MAGLDLPAYLGQAQTESSKPNDEATPGDKPALPPAPKGAIRN